MEMAIVDMGMDMDNAQMAMGMDMDNAQMDMAGLTICI